MKFVLAWKNGQKNVSLILEAVKLYLNEAKNLGCVTDEELMSYIKERIKSIASLYKVDIPNEVIEGAVEGAINNAKFLSIEKLGRLVRSNVVRLDVESYLLLKTYVQSGDCSYLRKAEDKIGKREIALLLRSWGFDETCDDIINNILREIRPEDSVDMKIEVDDLYVVTPGITTLNIFSREAIYMPIGMALTDVEKWHVYNAVAAFYQSLKAYPVYLVDFQWQNWRKFTSYDVAFFGGYAVDMSSEGLSEGCGVAYKSYEPAVFAHELIHCAQQAEGRVKDIASMELEAHAVEKLALLYVNGDELARKIVDTVRGNMGLYISSLTEDDIINIFAKHGIDIKALGYVINGVNLLAKPNWVQYYRVLGPLPATLTMFHNLVYLYVQNKSPMVASVLVDLFKQKIINKTSPMPSPIDLTKDREFLQEYAYFAEQYQRGRLGVAHVVSLVWLGYNKAFRALHDSEKAKKEVALVLSKKLSYTASSISIHGNNFIPPDVIDIIRQVPQFKLATSTVSSADVTLNSKNEEKKVFQECDSDKALYEAQNFAAEYRKHPKGYEDWQIVARVGIIAKEFLSAGCRKDHIIEYLAKLLDELGIRRERITRAYLHGTNPEVAEILIHLFPNLTWNIPKHVLTIIPRYKIKASDTTTTQKVQDHRNRSAIESSQKQLPVAKKISLTVLDGECVSVEDIKKELIGRTLAMGQQINITINGTQLRLVVTETQPLANVYVTPDTHVKILQPQCKGQNARQQSTTMPVATTLRSSSPQHFSKSQMSQIEHPTLLPVGHLVRGVGFAILFFIFVNILLNLGISYSDIVATILGYLLSSVVTPIYLLALRKDDVMIKSVTTGVTGFVAILVAYNIAESYLILTLGYLYSKVILFAFIWLTTWIVVKIQHRLENWSTSTVEKSGINLGIIGIGYLMLALAIFVSFLRKPKS